MSNKILIRRSSVAGRVPTIAQVEAGELALNTADKKLYFSTGAEVVELATAQQIPPNTLALCSDVLLAAPAGTDILRYSGTKWVNSPSAPGSASTVLNTWTSAGGSNYYQDFVHGLGTEALVISVFDNNTNLQVMVDSVAIRSINVVRITVVGNTRVLRVTAVANGLSVGALQLGLGTTIGQNTFANRPAPGIIDRLFLAYDTRVLYRDNGTTWEVMTASSGAVKTLSYFASSMDSPNTPDFAVNSLAPVVSDPLNSAINVRSFSNTVEQGVCITVPVPTGATSIQFNIRGHAATAPAGPAVVQHRLYRRIIPVNAAVPPWSAGTAFTAFNVPTNAFYQLIQQKYALATLGLLVGNTYQFEITRMTGVTNNLASAWLAAELTVIFD